MCLNLKSYKYNRINENKEKQEWHPKQKNIALDLYGINIFIAQKYLNISNYGLN